jgi:hypothetical protein
MFGANHQSPQIEALAVFIVRIDLEHQEPTTSLSETIARGQATRGSVKA